jgi:hypothetical protein
VKTAIQALHRLDAVLPCPEVGPSVTVFEYHRRGAPSLHAALDVKTGLTQMMTAGRPTAKEFIAFLEELVAQTPWAREIHIVLDKLSADKTMDVEE